MNRGLRATRNRGKVSVVADVDKGVDSDCDAWPNCAVFWWLVLNEAGRALRVENPYKGESDGMDDAERLNEA